MRAQTQMLDDLSEEDLCRIERLVGSASAGPWISYIVGRDAFAGYNRVELGGLCNELGSFPSLAIVGAQAADQDFIASARQDVPRLLHAVRALRARLQSLLAEEENPARQRRDAPDLSRSAQM